MVESQSGGELGFARQTILTARPEDEHAISSLSDQLGYPSTDLQIRVRLEAAPACRTAVER